MRLHQVKLICTVFVSGLLIAGVKAQELYTFKPDNPITSEWLNAHLLSAAPRLLLTPEVEKNLKNKLDYDTLVKNYYQYIKNRGDHYLTAGLLERKKIGKRLLSVSREAIARISTLALLYRIEKEQKYLTRLTGELNNICRFEDWNPSHFLDVAEMALGVSIGLDWCGAYFDPGTVAIVKKALEEKALLASIKDPPYGWITSEHNWNQVCHGGLSAAAIVLGNDKPGLAARILSRTLDNITYALVSYAPDGAFPEGPSYWFYATYYTAIMIAMFESAFITDFNLTGAPGFLESARYSLITVGPSGDFYNYFDAGKEGACSLQHLGILNWFQQHDTHYVYFYRSRYQAALQKAALNPDRFDRFSAITLLWLAAVEKSGVDQSLPLCWTGEGPNPLAVLCSPVHDASKFYLAAKGGKAALNHGNMDGGSFVFELNGVRWSIDPGNQGYYQLEQILGSGLWKRGQQSTRWSLLTKNNFGHSTLTINNELHNVNGYVPLIQSGCDEVSADVCFDLTGLFFGRVDKAWRTFRKEDDRTLVITDELSINDSTKSVTWSMMTRAGIEEQPDGLLLYQDGHKLALRVTSPLTFQIRIVSLDPPPLSYDKHIENLKRIEIRVLPSAFQGPDGKISVELSGIF